MPNLLNNIHWSRKRIIKHLPELLLHPSADYDIVVRALDKDGEPFAAQAFTLQEVHDAIFGDADE